MLDQIMNLAKSQAGEYLQKSDVELNDEQISGVQDAAQESIVDGLKGELMSGNISGLTGMLTGGSSGITGNPIVQKIIQMFGGSLVSKVGLGSGVATGLASGMIPNIIGTISSKFSSEDKGDAAFDLAALSGLAGGGGVGDMLKGAIGGGAGDMLKGAIGGGESKVDDVVSGIGGMFKK